MSKRHLNLSRSLGAPGKKGPADINICVVQTHDLASLLHPLWHLRGPWDDHGVTGAQQRTLGSPNIDLFRSGGGFDSPLLKVAPAPWTKEEVYFKAVSVYQDFDNQASGFRDIAKIKSFRNLLDFSGSMFHDFG